MPQPVSATAMPTRCAEGRALIVTLPCMTLTEIAQGLDIERDVLAAMDFTPLISPQLREMPAELFQETWGRLQHHMNTHS
jgi:acyl CoA:acetate/3-ketoacid CoA transferase